ncbi:MAG: hypothetical protein O2967_01450 [Proteobacteria bacterium]|nr:hypothetical protein [Pseudomonadota bacterium]
MRNGIAISTLLHAAVVAAAFFGLPDLLTPPQVMEQPIIVELVTVAERTVTQKPPEPKAEKPPPAAPELKAAEQPKPEPPVEKALPPEPAKKVEAPPPPPLPEPVKPKETTVPLPEPKFTKRPVEKPTIPLKLASAEPPEAFRTLPRPRARPKRARRQFSADRIAALLDKDQKEQPAEPRDQAAKSKAAKPPPSKARAPEPVARAQPMTMSEVDAIRHQIEKCWSIPAGARDAENLVVRIKIFLNTDGSLSKAPEIVGSNQSGDPFYRTAAESARRAVLKCQPLRNLPAEKYSNWREITLTFNPREMLGG